MSVTIARNRDKQQGAVRTCPILAYMPSSLAKYCTPQTSLAMHGRSERGVELGVVLGGLPCTGRCGRSPMTLAGGCTGGRALGDWSGTFGVVLLIGSCGIVFLILPRGICICIGDCVCVWATRSLSRTPTRGDMQDAESLAYRARRENMRAGPTLCIFCVIQT